MQQFTNSNRVHIRFILTSDTINDQLFGEDIFFKSKFQTDWFYNNKLEGDEVKNEGDGMSDRMMNEDSEHDFDNMFDEDGAS